MQQGLNLGKPVLTAASFRAQQQAVMDQIIECCIGIAQRRVLEMEVPVWRHRLLLNGVAGLLLQAF